MSAIVQRMLTPTPARTEWAPGELELFIEALPPLPAPVSRPPLYGCIGKRVQEHMRATLPEDDLRGFAREVLGAQRMSAAYLEALRIILGNQAHAERYRIPLELNIKTPYAPSVTERTMRTIIDQMTDAGITRGVHVGLGSGRVQVVQGFFPITPRPDLEAQLRMDEAPQPERPEPAPHIPASNTEEDVPF